MPTIGLRKVEFAKYTNNEGTISYGTPVDGGGPMNVNLELRFADGTLYTGDALSEFVRLAIGGTLSIGVKHIPEDTQKLLFGMTEKSRTLTVSSASTTVKSLQTTKNSRGDEVGVAFYAPDVLDGVSGFTCVFIPRARFGEPSMTLQTMQEGTITFGTLTTTGQFMADHSFEGVIKDVAYVEDEATAIAWCAACFGAN